MPTIYNKVTANGTTLIDLSQDTVSQASHIVAPYTAHLRDGTQVTGSASVRNDFIITLTYNSTTELWEPNKTFTEIQTAYTNNDNIIVNGFDADDELIQTSFGYSTTNTLFWYDVAWYDYDNNTFCHDYYEFNANNGLTLQYRNSYTTPPTFQAKTNINPTTSSQTIQADSGYDGLSSVQINAMPTGTVTAPSSISGTAATVSTGTNTLTLTKTVSVTPNVSTAGYISSGTAGNSSVSLTASVTTKAAATYNTSSTDQTIASGTYLTGTQTIRGVTVSGLDASKILSGTTIMVGDSADADRIASVSGSVTFSTIYTGSSTPSSSQGSNGDIFILTS